MDTRGYLQHVPQQASAINTQLMEIMMAQDFQDLTGQVIKKMMEVVNDVETQLLQVLIDNSPVEKRPRARAVRSAQTAQTVLATPAPRPIQSPASPLDGRCTGTRPPGASDLLGAASGF